MKSRTTRGRSQACLECGAEIDAQTSFGHKNNPYPGAIAICICGHIMSYDENLKFRQLTDQEIIDVAGDPEIIKIQNALAQVKRDKAIREEVEYILGAKLENFHPVVALIVNAPEGLPQYYAQEESLPDMIGYGDSPKDAIRSLLRSFVGEQIAHVTAKHQQRN